MISSKVDTRSSSSGQLVSTHDGDHIEALSLELASDITLRKEAVGVTDFFIDEGQFFSDLHNLHFILRGGANVYLAALDADYKQEPFLNVLSLIPLATKVSKLNAICSECGKENGICSVRLGGSIQGRFDVGGSEKYRATCLKCRDIVAFATTKGKEKK
jgi:thymidine kinase